MTPLQEFLLGFHMGLLAVPPAIHWLQIARGDEFLKFGPLDAGLVVLALRAWLFVYIARMFLQSKKNKYSLTFGLPIAVAGAALAFVAFPGQEGGFSVAYTENAHKGGSCWFTKGIVLMIVGAYSAVSPSVEVSLITASAVTCELAQLLVAWYWE